MNVVNELGQESGLLVDNTGSLKVSTGNTTSQFRKTFAVSEELLLGGDEITGGIVIEGNGINATATAGEVMYFPQINLNNTSATTPDGGTVAILPSATIGKGLGYIKIKDFDPNSYATKGRINVCISPKANTGEGGSTPASGQTSGGINPSTFRNYSYHIIGFNDNSNELTISNYGAIGGAQEYPTTPLQAFLTKPSGTPYGDSIGDSKQIVAVSIGRTNTTTTSQQIFSNLSDSFDLGYDNYFITFDNNKGLDGLRQPDLIVYITMTLYN